MHSAPTCPACGYDLRGEVASWSDRCPLTGRCSECGGGLDWGRVLVPGAQEFAKFESPLGWRLVSFLASVIAAPLPRAFWRRRSPEDPIRVRRLIGVALLGPVIVSGLLTGPLVLLAALVWGLSRAALTAGESLTEWLPAAAWPYGLWDEGDVEFLLSPAAVVTVVWFVVQGALAAMLAGSRRAAGLSMARVARAAAYSLAALPAAMLPWALSGLGTELYWDICWTFSATSDYDFYDSIERFNQGRVLVQAAFSGVWLWLWWGAALRWSSRARRPWIAAAGLTVLSGLVMGVLVVGLALALIMGELSGW